MTNHLRAIDIKEYAKALDVAKEFADRAEKAEAAVRRVRGVALRLRRDGPATAVRVLRASVALPDRPSRGRGQR